MFLEFLEQCASHAQALYVLGDLFEYWAGDDDLDTTFHQPVIQAMRHAADRGCRLYFMHGNRDFLLGEEFARASGGTLLPDPWLIDLYGQPALLSHGDLLCTDDRDYQNFRSLVRTPQWQKNFLARPLDERKTTIAQLRARSEQEKSYKATSIMDVNDQAVASLLRQHGYPPLLIHGHTHRPARHRIELDGRICERIVLPDWNECGGYLDCDGQDCVLQEFG
jgi:UDP-2,3-diacylglucosamine hydrolase